MLSRREFFSKMRSSTQKDKKPFVPLAPYNFNRDLFYKECLECEKPCIKACDDFCKEGNLKSGILKEIDGVVSVDFSISGCERCMECAKACEKGVLDVSVENSNTNWNFFVRIREDLCLAYQKTLCNSCKDICQGVNESRDIIKFAGLFYPEITDKCTGCGFCIAVCPTHSIQIIGEENV